MAILLMKDEHERIIRISSEAFAQSAFDNNVEVDDFVHSLNVFSARATCTRERIIAWREDAVDIFFKLMESAGKLNFTPTEFMGSSDYDD